MTRFPMLAAGAFVILACSCQPSANALDRAAATPVTANGSIGDQSPSLIYAASTGVLSYEPASPLQIIAGGEQIELNIWVFEVVSKGGSFLVEEQLNAVGGLQPYFLHGYGGCFDCNSANGIGTPWWQQIPADFEFPSTVSFGAVLPANLTESFLLEDLLAHGMDLLYIVPEPMTSSLFLAIAASIILRRLSYAT